MPKYPYGFVRIAKCLHELGHDLKHAGQLARNAGAMDCQHTLAVWVVCQRLREGLEPEAITPELLAGWQEWLQNR